MQPNGVIAELLGSGRPVGVRVIAPKRETEAVVGLGALE